MATFEIGTGFKQPDWCTALIKCGSSVGQCTEFIDSGAGVTVYHLYNVAGCDYISKSSLAVDIKHKDSDVWEPWATYTMGDFEGFAYTQITINDGMGFEFKATYKGITKYYSIVAPCVPDWLCETPLNGYEEDGCGNRRENVDCACVPEWQCRQPQDGYETDVNNCGEEDRFNEVCVDPCVGVTCPDYCDYDAHVKYVNGKCVDGSCVYDTEENSVECGYESYEGVIENNTKNLLIFGGVGAVALGIFLAVAKSK